MFSKGGIIMNLINMLNDSKELLDFEPLVLYLKEIENKKDIEIIFENGIYCYLKDDDYYYKIRCRLLESDLFSYDVSIGITDKNFFPVRYTSFVVRNRKVTNPKIPQNGINDNILYSDDKVATASINVYSYENNGLKCLSSKTMELSLLEANQIGNPNNFLDSDACLILNKAKNRNDFITKFRIMIDAGASGQMFSRLTFGPLRHRFIKENKDKHNFVYKLKKSNREN